MIFVLACPFTGKDLQWYTKKSKVDLKAAQDAERREIKLKEQDLMLQMLYVFAFVFPIRSKDILGPFLINFKSTVGKNQWSLLQGQTLTAYKKISC